ncbi:scyllo-inositol 2-dehydrogenase (NADP(+)) IolW [Abditibacteriota bacterium]|nr:scyllo-inositol 2-dehydrogenase (NADP(+)) IolW [Abditibacteriota bacterium]
MNKAKPIRVGIAGLGRSGWGIHARTLAEMSEQFQLVAVMDLDGARRAEGAEKFGCRTYEEFSALASDPNVEVVVVATPNFLHKSHVIEALKNGKHVICEKPFGADSSEADAMIEAAKAAGTLVAPFQNRRYEPHFLKVKDILESGILGEIHLIRMAWHGFKRRWDWQTLNEFGGGDLSNTGPHVIDHALQLFGATEPEVTVDLRNVLSSGDAEDHVKIVLKAPGAPLLDIELTSACAFPQERWLIMGSSGALRGTTTHLEWKWVNWEQYEPHSVEKKPTPNRAYNSEKLDWHSDSANVPDDFGATPHAFYTDFSRTLREGAPLTITPESVRRNIALIETCKRLASVQQGQFALHEDA